MAGNVDGRRRERQRKQRRGWVIGIAASAVIHAMVLGWGGLTVTHLPPNADRQVGENDLNDAFPNHLRIIKLRMADAGAEASSSGDAEAASGDAEAASEGAEVSSSAPEASEAEKATAPRLAALPIPRRNSVAEGLGELQLASIVPLPRVKLPISVPQRGVVLRDAATGKPWPGNDASSGTDGLDGDGRDRRRGGGITVRVGGADCGGSATGIGAAGVFDRFGGSSARAPLGRTGRGSLPGIRR